MKNRELIRKITFAFCCIGCAGCCIYLAIWFAAGQSVKARDAELAQWFRSAESAVENSVPADAPPGEAQADASRRMDELYRENEDLVGWLRIEGTEIDYPVVRHTDNEYYLSRNFWREADSYGAIFMDCANTRGFESPHVVLYGHNMKNKAMFGTLPQYLDAGYLSRNATVTITLPDGSVRAYRIFGARKAFADDPAYQTDFADEREFNAFAQGIGAPDAAALLTLSTCTNEDDTERVLVHAACIVA